MALLAIIGLIWLIAELLDDEPDVDDMAVVEEPVVVDDMDAEPMGPMVGDDVDLDRVRVERVIGDRTFTISAMDGSLDVPNLIVLDEQPTTPSEPGVEGRVDVNPGQVVSIEGTIMEMDGDPAQVLGITQAEADAVNATQMHILATTVEILEADLDNVEVN